MTLAGYYFAFDNCHDWLSGCRNKLEMRVLNMATQAPPNKLSITLVYYSNNDLTNKFQCMHNWMSLALNLCLHSSCSQRLVHELLLWETQPPLKMKRWWLQAVYNHINTNITLLGLSPSNTLGARRAPNSWRSCSRYCLIWSEDNQTDTETVLDGQLVSTHYIREYSTTRMKASHTYW